MPTSTRLRLSQRLLLRASRSEAPAIAVRKKPSRCAAEAKGLLPATKTRPLPNERPNLARAKAEPDAKGAGATDDVDVATAAVAIARAELTMPRPLKRPVQKPRAPKHPRRRPREQRIPGRLVPLPIPSAAESTPATLILAISTRGISIPATSIPTALSRRSSTRTLIREISTPAISIPEGLNPL